MRNLQSNSLIKIKFKAFQFNFYEFNLGILFMLSFLQVIDIFVSWW